MKNEGRNAGVEKAVQLKHWIKSTANWQITFLPAPKKF